MGQQLQCAVSNCVRNDGCRDAHLINEWELNVDSFIEVDEAGPHLRIAINRPDLSNRMSDAMIGRLTQILRDVGPHVAVVSIAARGPDFCLGWGDMAAAPQPGTIEALARRRDFDIVFGCYSAFRACPVPIVAAVQGRAAGLGCALVALSDLVVAAEGATFRLPEMEHHIMPTMVMSALIDRIPPKLINHLVYTAGAIDATEAKHGGLITEIVPESSVSARADALARTLLSRPAAALRGAKEFMQNAGNMDVTSAIQYARNLHAVINTSAELKRT
jgi:enoyl-CoA hydratase